VNEIQGTDGRGRRHRGRGAAAVGAILAGLLLIAGPLWVVAQTQLPEPTEGDYVYDFAEVWSDATERDAQETAEGIRARTQAVVVIV
jgi:hypothetical protein